MSLDVRESTEEQYDAGQERLKFIFLGAVYFFMIFGNSIIKDLKDVIFMNIVGRTYVPLAKILSMFVLIPPIFLYAKIVDKLRRYQLIAFFGAFFGIVGIILAIFLGNPTIGLMNTNTNPYRLFGWLVYFVVEGYSPFLVSVFWAFTHSITSPKGARNNYAFMVSASKVGGMLGAGGAWYMFSSYGSSTAFSLLADVRLHQAVFVGASVVVLMVPIVVYALMRNVSGRYLHGYEAAYKVEKEKGKQGKEETGIWAGLLMLLKYPYVLGIFGMIYFYELVNTVLGYLRLGEAQSQAANLAQQSSFLLQSTFMMHVLGFIIAFFGTSTLMRRLGERTCLLLIPVISGMLLFVYMIDTTPMVLTFAWVILKAVNYAFAWPVRESLYIPTVKSIKFKSKAWIDAFGSKFAKAGASTFNILMNFFEVTAMAMPIYSAFFATVVSLWVGVAYFLGHRYDKAVANNEVIGLESEGIAEK
ncbi:hypothetical protein E3J61_03265 [Candidatus Dependentiae bacterium]|nr:MAG: hypothetical protein E3J61_03265 [Candidatus Dependentiae bacterium]